LIQPRNRIGGASRPRADGDGVNMPEAKTERAKG
jgi:hypothetical protein